MKESNKEESTPALTGFKKTYSVWKEWKPKKPHSKTDTVKYCKMRMHYDDLTKFILHELKD